MITGNPLVLEISICIYIYKEQFLPRYTHTVNTQMHEYAHAGTHTQSGQQERKKYIPLGLFDCYLNKCGARYTHTHQIMRVVLPPKFKFQGLFQHFSNPNSAIQIY